MSVTERDRERALQYLADHAATWEAQFDAGPGRVIGLPDAAFLAAQLVADERARAVAPFLALAEPGDPNARMNAYYYGFERTGVGIVDAILSAVATAGKHYHGTEAWVDDCDLGGPSEEACIQAAADAAAARIRRAAQVP